MKHVALLALLPVVAAAAVMYLSVPITEPEKCNQLGPPFGKDGGMVAGIDCPTLGNDVVPYTEEMFRTADRRCWATRAISMVCEGYDE